MSGWVKVLNSLRSHPKVLRISEGAFTLHVCGLLYANDHLTDGFIETHALAVVAPICKQPKARAAELVRAGLWHEAPEGWVIHDYLKVQSSADAIEAKRRADADRQAKKRAANGRVSQ